MASQAGTIAVPVKVEAQPILVNRYIVARGSNQSVVLYWYQSRSRVVASEYSAKVYTVMDAVRFNRTDTALVRVVVAVNNGNTVGGRPDRYIVCPGILRAAETVFAVLDGLAEG